MKQILKKFAALLVSAMMIFGMALPAFAATTTGTITAPATSHTYEVYQIFTGDLDGTTLSNVKWGANGTGTKGNKVDATTLENVAAITGTNIAKASAISAYVDFDTDPVATLTNGESATVAAGYYLVKDKDGSVTAAGEAYTLYIVQIVGDVTISPKTGAPELVKKVQDTNDTTGTTTGWQDSADYDIGDTIPYQLTATMGDLNNYSHYYVEFSDRMSDGLTYKAITSVKVGDTTLTASQYTVTSSDHQLNVVINDVIALGATTGTKVVVEYTAVLNDKAVIGSEGNPNYAKLIYTNNPNNTGDGTTKPGSTGETPEDENIVFTYKVVANKVDSDENALVGASFELFKKDSTGAWNSLGEVDGTNASTFEWDGIDDGDYKIVETVTPAGYNTIDDQYFTVAAEHDTEADAPALTKLTGNATNGSVITLAADLTAGSLTTSIVNESGATLPTTGGMGTTIIYAAGAILVVGAAVLLIAKRKVRE